MKWVNPYDFLRAMELKSMELSRPEYWKLFPFPGDLPNPGIEPRSPALQANSLPTEPQQKPQRFPPVNESINKAFYGDWLLKAVGERGKQDL